MSTEFTFDHILMATDPVQLAEKMLTDLVPSFEELEIYKFPSDFEAHDDKFQGDLERRFNQAFEQVFTRLRSRFGDPATQDKPSAELPMNGFRSAVWLIEDKVMALVAGHEDRECPYVLLLSVTLKSSNR